MARILLSIGCAFVTLLLVAVSVARAEAAPSVHISLIQAAASDAKYERLDVTNYGDSAVDMTGWRFVYQSASGLTTTPLYTFSSSTNWHVLLGPLQTESLLSTEFAGSTPVGTPMRQALQFPAALNHLAGSIQLLDASGQVIDMVGWGSTAVAAVRQGNSAPAMTNTTWLVRQAVTGDNARDFMSVPQTSDHPMVIGSLEEVEDLCTNVPGLQVVIPDEYEAAGDGTCRPYDQCVNLDGIQADVPPGYEVDGTGNCEPRDACVNLDGVQTEVPPAYEVTAPGVCEERLPWRALTISELLPNPSGADTGNEFIELYNADTQAVMLDNYRLVIGTKVIALPAGSVIAPGQYWTVSDSELGVTLPNTTGGVVRLETIRGEKVMEVPAYKNAGDDMAWALLDGEWRFSYAPTPGSTNLRLDTAPCQAGYERSAETGYCRKSTVTAAMVAVPCDEGQYRSEVTGRCRALAVPATTVAPCKEGQYRSEATHRCRNLVTVTSAPKPCADDQFRNPLTQRCKAIASQDDVTLADCGEGRERNPDTHRCRNIVAASVAPAAFAATPVQQGPAAMAPWWALGGVGVLAAGYGGWEWRHELAVAARRIGAFIGRR